MTSQRTPSIAFYCHEGLGIGHLRRAVTIGRYLRRRWPDLAQLVVTSSAAAGGVIAWDAADYVKLPAMVRVKPEEAEQPFVPRALPISFQALRDMRRDILLSVFRNFTPDVLLVDYMPAGVKG